MIMKVPFSFLGLAVGPGVSGSAFSSRLMPKNRRQKKRFLERGHTMTSVAESDHIFRRACCRLMAKAPGRHRFERSNGTGWRLR
ncbi:hypothetical protein [Stutzerimonas urumqiensis]|uniref:hypothetical protein n=1 Tax=Stutzerimonas urumqiensis TaxID=638269 RepID=UPI003BAB7E2D